MLVVLHKPLTHSWLCNITVMKPPWSTSAFMQSDTLSSWHHTAENSTVKWGGQYCIHRSLIFDLWILLQPFSWKAHEGTCVTAGLVFLNYSRWLVKMKYWLTSRCHDGSSRLCSALNFVTLTWQESLKQIQWNDTWKAPKIIKKILHDMT